VNPLFVQVNSQDNVGIIVNPEGVREGAEFAGGLTARESIPQAHKITLAALPAGAPVIRYGEIIGHVTSDVEAGRWIREDMLTLPSAPPLDSLPLATRRQAAPEPLTGYTFEGYVNADGSVGTRNLLGITTTVQCVAPTVEYAVRKIEAEILPRYPNVDGVVAITHSYGCGVAIDAPGARVPIQTLGHISRHANIAGDPLVVSLGCEKLQPSRLLPFFEPNVIRLQDNRGFAATVAAICEQAEKRLAILNQRRRTTVPASELNVGLQCGGSDAFSGVTCNPAVGYFADLLVRAGGTVMFSEVTEVRDAVHLLTPRCQDEATALRLIEEMRWYDEYLARGGADRSANPTPGNKRGGLANVVEKALGSIAKAGTGNIHHVATHGEKVTAKGLVFAATPGQRLHLRHPAARQHEPPRLYHRRGFALRPRHGPRRQGLLPHRAGRKVAGPHRHRRRRHRHRPGHHRRCRLAALPLPARCRQRPHQNLGRAVASPQRARPFQPRPGHLASIVSRRVFTSGHSSAMTLKYTVSRTWPGTIMWRRSVPSCCAPMRSIARCERSFRASVFNSTRLHPSVSNACRNSRYLHSVFTAVRW
jgi:galactarate dehydratase